MTFIRWPEIVNFHTLRKNIRNYPHIVGDGNVTFRPKVKLHGANAGIQVRRKGITVQTREQFIAPGNDFAGLAAWAHRESQSFVDTGAAVDKVIFGEWCGPGINKGTALTQVSKKFFAVFAAAELGAFDNEESKLIVEPDELELLVAGVTDAYVLPWHSKSFNVNMLLNVDALQPVVDQINSDVAEVERCDPWVKSTFGIEGVGEGLVYYPLPTTVKTFTNLAFKAKGEAHKILTHGKPAQVDPEVAASAAGFVALVLSEARLEQGAASLGNEYHPRFIGPFLAWVCKDVFKEAQAELEASGLEWHDVRGQLQAAARAWYLKKCNETLRHGTI